MSRNQDDFEVTWEADDGYVGGSAPHRFDISADDIEFCGTDEELKNLFWKSIQEDFEQRVSPVCDQEEEFLEWAREVIEKRNQEEEDE